MDQNGRTLRACEAHNLDIIAKYLKARLPLIADAREKSHLRDASLMTVIALGIAEPLHQEAWPPIWL